MRSPCCPLVIWCKPTNDRVACHHQTKACNLNLRLLKPCVWLVLLQLRQTPHPGKNIFFDVRCNARLCVSFRRRLMRFYVAETPFVVNPAAWHFDGGFCRLQFVTKHRKIPKFLESENHKRMLRSSECQHIQTCCNACKYCGCKHSKHSIHTCGSLFLIMSKRFLFCLFFCHTSPWSQNVERN